MDQLMQYEPTELPGTLINPSWNNTPEQSTAETTETDSSIGVATTSTPTSWVDHLNRYREELKSNTSYSSNNRSSTTTTKTGSAEFEQAWSEYLKDHPEAAKWKNFLTSIAEKESGYRNIQNTAGAPAYGYFQLWHTNLQGYTPEQVLADPKLQIKLAIDLNERNLRTFTPEDFATAKRKGYTENALLWGAWLGGPGGVRKFLYEGIDPSDSQHYGGKGGSTVGTYMKIGNYKEGGSLKNVNLIKVGNKEFYIEIVESEEDKTTGLSDRDSLPKDEGMLFIIEDEEKDKNGLVWFTMEDTKFPLDIIFINEDLEVNQVSKGEPMDKTPISGSGDYVLEVNAGSGIEVGDDIEFISEKEVNKNMMVLDSEGNPQMVLDGGERIMSIKNTKTLIKFAKKASVTNNDNDYKALGKRVFKFLETQNNTDPEFV